MHNVHQDVIVVEPEIDSTTKNLSPAGVWLVRRYRVRHEIADLVAESAGLGGTFSMDQEAA